MARDGGRAARRPGEAAADAAGRLRGDLRGDGRLPGHDPAARPAAARVPAGAEEAVSDAMRRRAEQLHEQNPMLGTRGCRLGLQYPEIYEMQVRAIVRAARAVRERTGQAPLVEIMHPLVGFREELRRLRELTERVAAEEPSVDYRCGTMIELPRACIRADEIAEVADFCSFGTNDLTQTTLGLLARRRRGQVPHALPRARDPRAQPVRDARPERRRRPDAHRGRAGARRQARPEARHLRRARRRGRRRSRSATGSVSTTSAARPTACRSRGSPRPRRPSPKPASSRSPPAARGSSRRGCRRRRCSPCRSRRRSRARSTPASRSACASARRWRRFPRRGRRGGRRPRCSGS